MARFPRFHGPVLAGISTTTILVQHGRAGLRHIRERPGTLAARGNSPDGAALRVAGDAQVLDAGSLPVTQATGAVLMP
ncbi:hypothetical protein ABC383_21470 [Noviherbaspirillum sp. 1P10PC]|uniref:hypothetical protein n=1 Tax=Noviherbaspirillum sp. 1P10PC TaxID=3132292 RepID=UPI0039A2A7E2